MSGASLRSPATGGSRPLVPGALGRQPALRLRERRRAVSGAVLFRLRRRSAFAGGARGGARAARSLRRQARVVLRGQRGSGGRGRGAGGGLLSGLSRLLGFRRPGGAALRRAARRRGAGREGPADAAALGGARPDAAGDRRDALRGGPLGHRRGARPDSPRCRRRSVSPASSCRRRCLFLPNVFEPEFCAAPGRALRGARRRRDRGDARRRRQDHHGDGREPQAAAGLHDRGRRR